MSAKKKEAAENPFVANIAASAERTMRIFGGALPEGSLALLEEAPAAQEEAEAEEAQQTPKRRAPSRKPAPLEEEASVTTTVRFTPTQYRALRDEAYARVVASGRRGAGDASSVLRELVEEWLRKRER